LVGAPTPHVSQKRPAELEEPHEEGAGDIEKQSRNVALRIEYFNSRQACLIFLTT
jgi:hypothetical protein